MVLGKFVVNTVPVKVLFDAGATHSFINPNTAAQMTCVPEERDVCLCLSTPIGSTYWTELVAWNCENNPGQTFLCKPCPIGNIWL